MFLRHSAEMDATPSSSRHGNKIRFYEPNFSRYDTSMNRAVSTVLAILLAGALIFIVIFSHSTIHYGDQGVNTAAIGNTVSTTEASTVETPPLRRHSSTSTDAIPPSRRIASGIPNATSTNAVRIPTLVYHTIRSTDNSNIYNITPANFEKELTYLRDNGFTTITFGDIRAARDSNTPLPQKPVILTFDDGLIEHATYALPTLKKFGMKGVFYVYLNPINHENKKWMSWDDLEKLRDAGMEIGSHAYTHPKLTQITATTSEAVKLLLDKEILKPKTELENELNIKVLSIAYPFGLYNERVVDSVRVAGYQFGRTIFTGSWQDTAHDLEWSAQILNNDFGLFKRYMEKN